MRAGGIWLGLALVAPAFAALAAIVLVPAGLSLAETVGSPGGLTLARYRHFFTDAESLDNLRITMEITLGSIALLLVVGLGLALYLRFGRSRFLPAIRTLALFPLFVPGVIAGFALIRFLGPTGLLPLALRALGLTGYQTPYLHASGAVIGLVWENLPLTVMLLAAGLSQIPDAAIEAARDVGAGRGRIALHIVLPQLGRTLAVIVCLDFLQIFGAFTIPYLLGPAAPQMMSIFMQRTFSEVGDAGAAQTQAGVSFLVCATVGAVYTLLVFRGSARAGTRLR